MKKILLFVAICFCSAGALNAQPHWKMLTADKIPTRCVHNLDGTIYVGVCGNNDHGLIRSSNGGANWEDVSLSFEDQNVYSFDLDGPMQYVGTGFGLFSSFNKGVSWNKEAISSGDELVNAIATRGNETFIGTSNGLKYRPDDETIWSRIGIYGANLAYVTDLRIAGDTVFACDISYGVYFTTDAGTSWKRLYCKNAKSYTSISYSEGNLFVGTDVGAFYWNKTSDTLAQVFSGKYVHSVANFLSNVFIGTNDGVYHSKDYGSGWWEYFDADSVVLSAYDLRIDNYTLYAASYYGAYSIDVSYLGTEAEPEGLVQSASPNPACSSVSISHPVPGSVYRLVNALGELVSERPASNALSISFDINCLPRGLYFVMDSKGVVSKFVKE